MGGVFERHAGMGQMTRDGVRKLGLSLFPQEESFASNTVTAVNVPEGVEASKLIGMLRTEHDIVLSGGQQSLNGKIFRIGHLGYVTEEHVQAGLNALEDTLARLGRPYPAARV